MVLAEDCFCRAKSGHVLLCDGLYRNGPCEASTVGPENVGPRFALDPSRVMSTVGPETVGSRFDLAPIEQRRQILLRLLSSIKSATLFARKRDPVIRQAVEQDEWPIDA